MCLLFNSRSISTSLRVAFRCHNLIRPDFTLWERALETDVPILSLTNTSLGAYDRTTLSECMRWKKHDHSSSTWIQTFGSLLWFFFIHLMRSTTRKFLLGMNVIYYGWNLSTPFMPTLQWISWWWSRSDNNLAVTEKTVCSSLPLLMIKMDYFSFHLRWPSNALSLWRSRWNQLSGLAKCLWFHSSL